MLTNELVWKIFEFDSTYRPDYNLVMEELLLRSKMRENKWVKEEDDDLDLFYFVDRVLCVFIPYYRCPNSHD